MKHTAILFSGQGAQSVGMGEDLFQASPSARALFAMGETLCPGITERCFHGDAEQLKQTENAQPALFLVGLAFADALREAGVQADAAAGFSLGEIPALAFTGILSPEDAFRLVCARAGKMAELSRVHPGGMVAALKLPFPKIEALCEEFTEVWPVNYNCPGQLCCAGNPDQLDAFAARVKEEGGRGVKLAVSGAFHTPYMDAAGDVLRDTLAGMAMKAPEIPLYANRTAAPYPSDRKGMTDNVAAQVCSPVLWEALLRQMWKDGITTFIEVGAGTTLTGFVKRTLPEAATYTVTDVPSLQAAVAELCGGENHE